MAMPKILPQPITGGELILNAKSRPERKTWYMPFMFEGALGMLFAGTGIGKTYFIYHLALSAAANRPFLKWMPEAPARLLYLDSELTEQDMCERQVMAMRSDICDHAPHLFKYLCCDQFDDGVLPPISDRKFHPYYTELASDRDVIVIDNLSGVMHRMGSEPEENTWRRVKDWLLLQRKLGKCVILVHHAGKSGDYLGTSRIAQNLNWVVKLSRPIDYETAQGARFELRFEKTRSFGGELVEPIIAQMKPCGEGVAWEWSKLNSHQATQVLELHSSGMKPRDIQSALSLPLMAVKKIIASDTKISIPDIEDGVTDLF